MNNSKDLLKIEKMNVLSNARDAEKVQAALTISRMIIGADPSADPKSLVKITQDSLAAPEASTVVQPKK